VSLVPVPRPILIPGLSRAWRAPTTLQLGHDPARAVLIDLPDPRAAALLDLLDGTRSERAALAQAAAAGVRLGDARELLDTLHAAGLVIPAASLLPATSGEPLHSRLINEAAALALRRVADPLTPAQILRRRAGARVVITGRGRLGAGIAVALAEAGVGHVHPDLSGVVSATEPAGGPLRAADIGRPRAEAVVAMVESAVPGTRTRAVRRPEPDLTVQLDHDQPVALLAAAYARRRQPHLAVTVREGAAQIGPLVPATGAPCLNCVDLYRRERDAGRPAGAELCAVATVLAATAYAAAEVLAFLDGHTPHTGGASVEITAPGELRRRTWPPHPGCGCAAR
jgi:hypothetical protein